MLREPDQTVVSWLDRQEVDSIWLTTITVFEIRFGIGLLSPAKRRRALEEAFSRSVEEDFERRVLAFDSQSARHAADLAAQRRPGGKPVDFRDVEIAGIAASTQSALATRNIRDFQGLGIALIDPWG